MSAMPAEKVTEPENLYSPPEEIRKTIDKILEDLPPESGREFIHQILEAWEQSRVEGDLRHLNTALQSWVRTWMFMTRPRFDDLWAEAERMEGPRLTVDDIRRRRAQRAR